MNTATTIQFVGLFIVMLQGGGTGGLHILMSHYPSLPDHQTVIAYNPKQLAALPVWNPPPVDCVVGGQKLTCAQVGVQTIRFSGQNDPAPGQLIGAISHLTCCCPAATKPKAAFFDDSIPPAERASAHVFIDQGVAEAITDKETGRTDAVVTMHTADSAGITITATLPTETSTLVFNSGATVYFANTAPMQSMEKPHFYSYYDAFEGVPCQSDSKAKPTAGPPCAASLNACLLPEKAQAAKRPKRNAYDLVKAGKIKLAGNKRHRVFFDVGADCSNSHFP
jgi:hypothetical protein